MGASSHPHRSADRAAEGTGRDGTAQRLLNLLFILNATSAPIPTGEIISDSDLGYGSANPESDKRKFLRDRERLAELGIAVREVTREGGSESEESCWALDRARTFTGAAILSDDAQALLTAIDEYLPAAPALLARPVRSLRAKICTAAVAPDNASRGGEAVCSPAEEAIWTAFCLRRHMTCLYRNAHGDETKRTVAVYGIFSHEGLTYFTGLDTATGSVRTFRTDRVARVWRPAKPYEIPADFDIRDYLFLLFDFADAEATPATFSFPSTLPEGEIDSITHGRGIRETQGDTTLWRIEVRSMDAAAAFALSHAGCGMRPVAPEALVLSWKDAIRKAMARHENR